MFDSRLFVYGDTHGDTKEHVRLIEKAQSLGIKRMHQMGDCGFFPAYMDTWEGINTVQEALAEYGIDDYWTRGNHDDPYEWEKFVRNSPNAEGWGILRPNIFLAPRVHYFTHNSIRFLSVGGAVSIDRAHRMSKEPRPNMLWFPDEKITDRDLSMVTDQHVDVLFTHDCSNHTHFDGAIREDPDSVINRRMVDDVLRRSRPSFHMHGHMHRKYDWMNYFSHGGNHTTRTIGLQCNPKGMRGGAKAGYGQPYYEDDDMYENWGVFDTVTTRWTWGSDGQTS